MDADLAALPLASAADYIAAVAQHVSSVCVITTALEGERFGLTLQTVVDRDKFGVSWNNPLPSGEPALSNEVTITAELQLSKQA